MEKSITRTMCDECPFNPKSLYFFRRDDWGSHLDEAMASENLTEQGYAITCHKIENAAETQNANEQCIGHLDWIAGIKHGT